MDILYKNKSVQLLFRKSFCAYIDILGFSDKIKANDLTFFETYLNVLNQELNYIEKRHGLSGSKKVKEFALKIFTDNFVFGHPWYEQSGEVELGTIFEVLSHIQLTFTKSNIFVRGAICMSDLYMDENIVLGPALIEAYKMESEKAIYPRIILSEDVINVVKEHLTYYGNNGSAPQNNEYLIDIDGHYFVNYLSTLFYWGDCPESTILKELIQHKNIVAQNLIQFKDNFKLYDKFSWVAKYHNYFCNNFIKPKFPQIKSVDIKIDENLYLKTIRKIV